MITLNTDIKIQFDEVRTVMMQHLDGKKDELTKIVKDAIDNFNFEQVLSIKIDNLLDESLHIALDEMDFSKDIREIIFKEDEKRIK